MWWYLREGYGLVARIKLAAEIGCGSVHCKIQQVGITFTAPDFADKLGDVLFGVFLPVGLLVLVGLAVTYIVSSYSGKE